MFHNFAHVAILILGISVICHSFLSDSKTLSEEEREGIFERICAASDMMAWIVELLSPTFISNGMLSRYNISELLMLMRLSLTVVQYLCCN